MMQIVASPQDLRAAAPRGCVFVPTMGALHRGHARLIEEAVRIRNPGQPVVVSVFVNPTQFDQQSDYARYPRTLQADADLCESAGADVVFAPAPGTVYPEGHAVPIPDLPRVATEPGLEDARRPGHFAGVCQVVARLFELVRPQAAVFGEKDWQQLQVIRTMVSCCVNFNGVPRIVGVPTVREPDGLAMSSRNRFLTPSERARAATIHRALVRGAQAETPRLAEYRMAEELTDAGLTIEYAVVRDAQTLNEIPQPEHRPSSAHGELRALIAARLGSVRLIDNAPWPGGPA